MIQLVKKEEKQPVSLCTDDAARRRNKQVDAIVAEILENVQPGR